MKRGSKVEGRGSKVFRPLLPLCVVLSFAASDAFGASRPESEQARIDWLLLEVGNSKGTFIRNGKEYDAAKAVSHLKTKLLFAGRRVQTVKQFIVGVASHSEETGKPYEIRLPDGKQGPMLAWLLERLAVYEKGAASQKPAVPPTAAPAPLPPRKRSPDETPAQILRQIVSTAAAISAGC